MVYMGSPYIFYIYMIKCGWLGRDCACCVAVGGVSGGRVQ